MFDILFENSLVNKFLWGNKYIDMIDGINFF